jgi:hypothetical protein
MDMRYVVSALIGAFCLFAILAAITTARHLSQREGSTGTVRTKQSRQAEYDRLTALPRVLPDGHGEMSGAC